VGYKHLECHRQLASSHFQNNRGELEKFLAQRRTKLRSEVEKYSRIRRNDNLVPGKEMTATEDGGI